MAIYEKPELKPVEFTDSSFESDRDDYEGFGGKSGSIDFKTFKKSIPNPKPGSPY